MAPGPLDPPLQTDQLIGIFCSPIEAEQKGLSTVTEEVRQRVMLLPHNCNGKKLDPSNGDRKCCLKLIESC